MSTAVNEIGQRRSPTAPTRHRGRARERANRLGPVLELRDAAGAHGRQLGARKTKWDSRSCGGGASVGA